ncbi:MAG: pyridoxine 5'-phosphate synthase [Candidatus Omnitrophota bacterium]|jgi:pyridoxine 5-phosphate synthase|nr:MAG: pyridoxine 5'-phosphate synthase [Candidatus Omnitrophota bacterium]
MLKLGVNVDHVATIRQARGGCYPDPVNAGLICESSGADSIVAHLREDRRHIQERDLFLLRKLLRTRLNLEMSCSDEIVRVALKVLPDQATLVPEKRQELTTEGGLDVLANMPQVIKACRALKNKNIDVSIFLDPDKKQIDASKKIGVKMIELHTGRFANSRNKQQYNKNFLELKKAARYAAKCGLRVFAGHGLNYDNVPDIVKIKEIEELNIGHAIISRALFVGLRYAVTEMKNLIKR